MEPDLMTSGVFSKRTRLSPKALRIYEEKGLLTPWTIDPDNGYRYYAESQLKQARLISLLRRLEMPLKLIAEVVELDPEVAIKEIGAYWESVEVDIKTRRRLVRYLNQYLIGKGQTMFTVETRETDEQKVASIEERHFVGTLSPFIDRAMGTIYGHLQGAGVETGTPFVIYHGEVNNDSDGPVEVCVPFEGSVEPLEDIRVRKESGGREAFARITKGQVEFPRILEAYDAVAAWIEENGESDRGAPREIYFGDWAAIGNDDPAVDIAYPLK
jgi:DNA-binding transcriptional MerR regulator